MSILNLTIKKWDRHFFRRCILHCNFRPCDVSKIVVTRLSQTHHRKLNGWIHKFGWCNKLCVSLRPSMMSSNMTSLIMWVTSREQFSATLTSKNKTSRYFLVQAFWLLISIWICVSTECKPSPSCNSRSTLSISSKVRKWFLYLVQVHFHHRSLSNVTIGSQM